MDNKAKCSNRKCGWIGIESEMRQVVIRPYVKESRCPRCDCNFFFYKLKPHEVEKLKSGAQLIELERDRQMNIEGWTPEHDDQHSERELLRAALAYSMSSMNDADYNEHALSEWPWGESWWKPSNDPIRNLVKAGALIAAEIDRLQRLKKSVSESKP